MPSEQATYTSKIIEKNISYYNEVAGTYNAIMDEQESNKVVREMVKAKFLHTVEAGTTLDFGGGTGLDLPWLTEKYNVIFCEPSDGMREKASKAVEEILRGKNVTILEPAKTNFTSWANQPPFAKEVDAILANFGVLNYIPDLESLFKNLGPVLKPGGHFIILVLALELKKRLKWHRRNALKSLLFRRPFTMYIPYKDQKQLVFVHTHYEIKQACQKYFTCRSAESLKGYDFTLIHLVRK